jgi:hypothetical protein
VLLPLTGSVSVTGPGPIRTTSVDVRCPFYEPKDSQRLLILEAEGNLIRLRQDLYLTDEEQAVIDGDVDAYRALRQRNWEMPTPAGPTPHQLAEVEDGLEQVIATQGS